MRASAWAALALACGPRTPGANPHDMSTAQHEATAREEQAKTQTHAAQYDPNAKATAQSCTDLLGSAVCWSSTTNPTKEHLESAEEHRRRAADHRAASQALRDAEARACAGISERDRDQSPFAHREDIAAVSPLYKADWGPGRLEGAVVTFRAVPGMKAEWLQRIVDCHLARAASLGHVVSEMPYCPLVPKGVTATVRSAPAGFAVEIRAAHAEDAGEVWRRAETLAPARRPGASRPLSSSESGGNLARAPTEAVSQRQLDRVAVSKCKTELEGDIPCP